MIIAEDRYMSMNAAHLTNIANNMSEIARQLKIANSLQKVKMGYEFSNRLDGLQLSEASKQIMNNDFNNAIDMAFDQ